MEWIYKLFCTCLDLDTVSKIWDLWLYFGEFILFKTAIAILYLLKSDLLNKDYDDIIFIIKN